MIANSRGRAAKAQVYKLLYSENVYAIWKERDMMIFEKRSREVETAAREAADRVCNGAPSKITVVLALQQTHNNGPSLVVVVTHLAAAKFAKRNTCRGFLSHRSS
ncbi:hypothetical protein HAX54_034344 [Datura stramonium]|uniref:Protein-serine/threonine phosphatase n=1 Tax=Datura stramonium TaxID=4076 RepID=A0ABS8VEY4_DATST|nr:hypothetical protein [Datura stramonium]